MGACALAVALRGYPSAALTELVCYNNRIGNAGATEFGLMLASNTVLVMCVNPCMHVCVFMWVFYRSVALVPLCNLPEAAHLVSGREQHRR